jgi:hypothetical protein
MNQQNFNHPALDLTEKLSCVYTAMSKHLFYYRQHISKFVLEQNRVPLNPFMLFDYFLLDSVDRNTIRQANNTVLLKADEIWVFGSISNGVLSEILLAQKANKPIYYYKIDKPHKIVPINIIENVEMEEEVQEHKNSLRIFSQAPANV